MKTNVCTMRVNEVISNEFGSAEIHLISEIDFANVSPLELLQSGGVRKSVMFLRNLGDDKTIELVKQKLLNQVINVCEYRFEIGELFAGKSTITQVNQDGEESTFSQLVSTMPCNSDFQPTETDIENAKSTLIAQANRRLANNTYTIKLYKRC